MAELSDFSKQVDKSIIEFLEEVVTVFGWSYDKKFSELEAQWDDNKEVYVLSFDLAFDRDALHPESEWRDGGGPYHLRANRLYHLRANHLYKKMVDMEAEVEPPTINYILFYDGIEMGRWVLPYRLTYQEHLKAVSTVIEKNRLAFSDEPGYERIPDEVRDLDAKFKALTARLVDHLRQSVMAEQG